jgi:hypothetical protein
MTQRELNEAVARVTGESLATVAGLGFSLADPITVKHDPEPWGSPWDRNLSPEGKSLDWDDLDGNRRVAILPQRRRRLVPV